MGLRSNIHIFVPFVPIILKIQDGNPIFKYLKISYLFRWVFNYKYWRIYICLLEYNLQSCKAVSPTCLTASPIRSDSKMWLVAWSSKKSIGLLTLLWVVICTLFWGSSFYLQLKYHITRVKCNFYLWSKMVFKNAPQITQSEADSFGNVYFL